MTEIRVDVDLAHPPERLRAALDRLAAEEAGFAARQADVEPPPSSDGALFHRGPRLNAPGRSASAPELTSHVRAPSSAAVRGRVPATEVARLAATFHDVVPGEGAGEASPGAADEEDLARVNRAGSATGSEDHRGLTGEPHDRRAAGVPGGPHALPEHPGYAVGAGGASSGPARGRRGQARSGWWRELPSRAVEAGAVLLRAGWERVVAVPTWSPERRSEAVALGAALVLVLAMIALLIGRSTAAPP